jgi:putative hemolysin
MFTPAPALYVLAPAGLSLVLRAWLVAGDTALEGVGSEEAAGHAARKWTGRLLLKLKQDPERTHGGVRAALALTLASTAALTSTAAVQAGRGLEGPETLWGLAGALGAWLMSVVTDALSRSAAAGHPRFWAIVTAPLLYAAREVLAPSVRLATALVDLVLRPFGLKTRFSAPTPPLEEIQRMLEQSPPEGAPEPALVRSLFEFSEQTVKEIMVPRTDVVAIPHDAAPADVLQTLVEEGHTRVPVYRGTLDTIVGLIHVKDVLPFVTNPGLIILHDLLRPVTFVPWNTPVPKVMRQLQRTRQHLAVVVDEYGGMAGIVTLEDVVEQLVGDIHDEFDEVESPAVVSSADGTTLVRGEMRVAEFNEAFGAEVPEDVGYETMGGFLASLAGAIPAEQDRFYHGGLEFLVVRRDPRRVVEIKVTRTRAGQDAPGTEARA